VGREISNQNLFNAVLKVEIKLLVGLVIRRSHLNHDCRGGEPRPARVTSMYAEIGNPKIGFVAQIEFET
jgi:hypothetical protein